MSKAESWGIAGLDSSEGEDGDAASRQVEADMSAGGGRSTGGSGSPIAGLKSVSPPAFGKGPGGNIPASSGADELDGTSWLFGRSYAIAGSGSFSQSDGKAL